MRIALIAVSAAVLSGAVLTGPGPGLAGRGRPAPPERFTVRSDGHPMAVWARRPASPTGTVLLLHGRTWSSLPDFDLQVPGLERSVMAALSARGLAAYALDLRGYGQTPRDSTGWLTPRRAASDVINVLGWVASQHPTLGPPALVGWSRGAMIGQLVSQVAPARVSALVVFGFAWDPDTTFVDPVLPPEPAREPNNAAAAASDFISPAVTPRAVIDAFVEQALAADPVLADLRADGEFNALKPEQVTVPTLVIFGERDPGVLQTDAAKYFARLRTPDKQMVVLPGADHAAHVEDTHEAWVTVVAGFLTRARPKR
ncbi:MAG TPA: alpha/beta fold hydrolase [Vicinamibacterales bacterium]|nr:alpha/beta fold hydrolase [Vicinamibacterales bacterium]